MIPIKNEIKCSCEQGDFSYIFTVLKDGYMVCAVCGRRLQKSKDPSLFWGVPPFLTTSVNSTSTWRISSV